MGNDDGGTDGADDGSDDADDGGSDGTDNGGSDCNGDNCGVDGGNNCCRCCNNCYSLSVAKHLAFQATVIRKFSPMSIRTFYP